MSLKLWSATLVLLSGVGFYTTWVFSQGNGTFSAIRSILEEGPSHLPGTKEPLRTVYTGIAPIDFQLQVLALFFWPLLTGQHAGASIQTTGFSGQFAGAYVLVLVEGMRRANKGKIISYVMLWGLGFQNLAYAVCIPAMLGIQIATRSLVTSSPVPNILPEAAEVASVPFSVFLGYWLPVSLMGLPFPDQVDSDTKQIFMAIWQIFPINIAILQQIIKRISGSFRTLSTSSKSTTIWSLRFAYSFGLAMAAYTHISSLAEAVSFDQIPSLDNLRMEDYTDLVQAFVPSVYSHNQSVSSIAEGALTFLQYDYIVGTSATLLWALVVFFDAKPWSGSSISAVAMFLAGTFSLLLSGPVGCATVLIWIKDEVLVERAITGPKKKN